MVPPVTVRSPVAWMPSSPAVSFRVPPVTVTVPAETVSSSSGSALMASPSASTVISPPRMTTALSLAMPLFAAVTRSVTPSSTVTVLSAPPLMPFLHCEPSAISVPLPVTVRLAPDLTLIAAPSKASATASSALSSSAGSSASVRVTVPVTKRVTSLSLLQHSGEPSVLVSVRSSRISVTPVVPFLTVMLPSLHVPVMRYVPAALRDSAVPSIS